MEPPLAYGRLIERLHEVYFEPEDLNAEEMLWHAAVRLERDVPWLFVARDGSEVVLRHHDQDVVGRYTVATTSDLPEVLTRMLEDVRARDGALDRRALRVALLGGMTDTFDRFTRVVADDALDRFKTRLSGTLTGVGATLRRSKREVIIVGVVPGAPADVAGLRPGDRLTAVDGVSTLNLPLKDVVQRIKGPEGTSVDVVTSRAGSSQTTTLVRRTVVVPNVRRRSLEGGMGYIHISHISKRTVNNLYGELASLLEEGAMDRGLVLDLRGNSGGSMKQSARVADVFVKQGLLLRTSGSDGGPVKGLMHRIDARDNGLEITSPVVVLIDRASASGAEIIAGALKTLRRAVLIGERTYGKGAVQLLTRLEPGVQLNVTAAEYRLAGDTAVHEIGVHPDVTLGEVRLDASGIRYLDWDPEREGTSWDAFVPVVDERSGWRGAAGLRTDVALELGRRVLERHDGGPSRLSLLQTLRDEAAVIGAEQESLLVEALAAREVDWQPAVVRLPKPEARVALEVAPVAVDADGRARVRIDAQVTNDGPTDLYRTLVRLSSEYFGFWDDLVVPVGRVASGSVGSGTLELQLAAGVQPRTDRVAVQLLAHQRPTMTVGTSQLHVESGDLPDLALDVVARQKGQEAVAEVAIRHLGGPIPEALELFFVAPEDEGIQLLDAATRLELDPEQTSWSTSLRLGLDGFSGEALPLKLVVEADGLGELDAFEVTLPLSGERRTLRPPRIRWEGLDETSRTTNIRPQLFVDDEDGIGHVLVWVNERKVAYFDAARGIDATMDVRLEQGNNTVSVTAVDAMGHVERLTRSVWVER